MIRFTVYGVAQPQGSMRAFTPKGWKRPILTSDNPQNKGWRQLVAEEASAALNVLPAADRVQLRGAVCLTLGIYLPRPKRFDRPGLQPAHLTKPDLSKLIRSVEDALTKVLWVDDSQVVEIRATKHYAGVGEPPYMTVQVETAAARPVLVAPSAPLPLLEQAAR